MNWVVPALLVDKPHTVMTSEWWLTVNCWHINSMTEDEMMMVLPTVVMLLHLVGVMCYAVFDMMKMYW